MLRCLIQKRSLIKIMARKKFSPEEARKRARQKMQNSMAMLEQGVLALVESERWQQYLRVQSRFHGYSFFNTMLILLQNPDATRVAGFTTWKKLGRYVRAGEKGIAILVPYIGRVKNNDRTWADKSDIALDKDGHDTNRWSDETKAVRYFGVGYVYDEAQTEGQALPEVCNLLNGSDELALNARVDQVITKHGYEVTVVLRSTVGGANGLCDYRARRISVASDLSPLHSIKTRLHELAHSMMHSEDEYWVHGNKSVIELEAESVAFVVLSHFGIDSSDFSFGYLATWQEGDKSKIIDTLRTSGKRIQSTAEEIINQIESLLGSRPNEIDGPVMIELPTMALEKPEFQPITLPQIPDFEQTNISR